MNKQGKDLNDSLRVLQRGSFVADISALWDELKKTLADYYRKVDYDIVIGEKIYTGPELAEEIEKETEDGRFMIKIALEGTIHRMKEYGTI
jgi:hypothetical protein